jgi:MerR family transcriptional regulator, light-induced transcriptional regulator
MIASPYHESARIITEHIAELAQKVYDLQMKQNSDMMRGYTPYQKQKCLRDEIHNLSYLAEVLSLDSVKLWTSYLQWLKILLVSLGVKNPQTVEHFEIMLQVLKAYLPSSDMPKVQELIAIAITHFQDDVIHEYQGLDPQNPRYDQARNYQNMLLSAQKNKAADYILSLATSAQDIREIYLNILQPVQRNIGLLWHTNKISVAQEHYCTGVTQMVISLLYPKLFDASPKDYRMISACVSGELHEIGLRMVTDIMEIDGWDTTFLGANMPDEGIVETIIEKKADLVAISVTFPLNLHKAESLINLIKGDALAAKAKILVGGYPFLTDDSLWQKIGADACAADASLANSVARNLIQRPA